MECSLSVSSASELCFILDKLHFPGGSDGKESAHNAGYLGLIPGLGRSPGEGNGNPLRYSCLEKSDRKSTRLNSSHRHTSRMPSSA